MILEKTIKRLELLHPKVIDLSLERLEKLLIKLDNPEKKLPPIFLSRILQKIESESNCGKQHHSIEESSLTKAMSAVQGHGFMSKRVSLKR